MMIITWSISVHSQTWDWFIPNSSVTSRWLSHPSDLMTATCTTGPFQEEVMGEIFVKAPVLWSFYSDMHFINFNNYNNSRLLDQTCYHLPASHTSHSVTSNVLQYASSQQSSSSHKKKNVFSFFVFLQKGIWFPRYFMLNTACSLAW